MDWNVNSLFGNYKTKAVKIRGKGNEARKNTKRSDVLLHWLLLYKLLYQYTIGGLLLYKLHYHYTIGDSALACNQSKVLCWKGCKKDLYLERGKRKRTYTFYPLCVTFLFGQDSPHKFHSLHLANHSRSQIPQSPI